MKRGEIWWARLDGPEPVVLLSADEPELRTMRIVPPATAAEKRGFVVLSGAEAFDTRIRRQIVAAAGDAGGVGIEVDLGTSEGLPFPGVVRVALPRDGHVFCTWLLTLTPDCLIERIGSLSPEKLRHFDNALRLAAVE